MSIEIKASKTNSWRSKPFEQQHPKDTPTTKGLDTTTVAVINYKNPVFRITFGSIISHFHLHKTRIQHDNVLFEETVKAHEPKNLRKIVLPLLHKCLNLISMEAQLKL